MKDEQMGNLNPGAARQQGHQVLLNLLRCCGRGQPQPLRQPLHVRIHHHPLRLTINLAQYHVGRLAGHARQHQQRGHLVWHLLAVLCHQQMGRLLNVARLLPVEAGRAHNFLQRGPVGGGQGGRVWVAGKQHRRHLVHPFVGTLGGENGGHQQLQGIVIVQGAVGVGVSLAQSLQDKWQALPGRGGHRWQQFRHLLIHSFTSGAPILQNNRVRA